MKVSNHAGQRFLERVVSITDYTCFDVNTAIAYLERVLKDVIPSSRIAQFALPGFENYKVIYVDNTAVTIIPKGGKRS